MPSVPVRPKPNLASFTMPHPVIIVASFLTTIKSAWELSRMVREKRAAKSLKTETKSTLVLLQRAYRKGLLLERHGVLNWLTLEHGSRERELESKAPEQVRGYKHVLVTLLLLYFLPYLPSMDLGGKPSLKNRFEASMVDEVVDYIDG
ncbi:hypothetical protein BT67DRAFT_434048 [Trichocladium antarcticum]|uniref:Uncharacterized protein n=1 Tax=Trichocladium antarcticum TaxID=1450529 RepID=A0AAN6UKI2_9PEZI|nr:hypothetical protein BT67DRAFT_434048 [Trichocladium antarcticum]